MPLITVDMLEGRTLDQKRALVRELTDAFGRTCGQDAATRLRVIIHEVPTENWGIGGELVVDRDEAAGTDARPELAETRSAETQSAETQSAETRSAETRPVGTERPASD